MVCQAVEQTLYEKKKDRTKQNKKNRSKRFQQQTPAGMTSLDLEFVLPVIYSFYLQVMKVVEEGTNC